MTFSEKIRAFRRSIAGRSAIILHALSGSQSRNSFGILMYHRVAEHVRGVAPPTWNVTPERFQSQLQGLQARGYDAWPLRKVLEYSRGGKQIPPKTFIVTFDDGYENVFTNAYPILKELQIPATVFLATAYLDQKTSFPFDDWTASGTSDAPTHSWLPLSTTQCRAMQQSGLIELGAHTHTHADFRGRPEYLRADLKKSIELLRERFDLSEVTFAFPYGTKHLGFAGGELTAAARETGVLCSLTTESETVDPQSDPFDWGRFTAESFDNSAVLAAKLSGCYTLTRDLWRRIRLSRKKKFLTAAPVSFHSPQKAERIVT